MEKEGEVEKKEPKEVTDAGASGAFEPALSTPILKRDIQNFKLKSKKQEVDEVTGSGVSAGAMYDAPIGTKKKDPLAIDNPPSKKSSTESASITAASTKNMIATKKGFPKFGGPDAKFVEINGVVANKKKNTVTGITPHFSTYVLGIKDKCKKFPYCNQMSGLDNLTLYESAIHQAAEKYGLTVKQVQDIIIKESIDITGDKVK